MKNIIDLNDFPKCNLFIPHGAKITGDQKADESGIEFSCSGEGWTILACHSCLLYAPNLEEYEAYCEKHGIEVKK